MSRAPGDQTLATVRARVALHAFGALDELLAVPPAAQDGEWRAALAGALAAARYAVTHVDARSVGRAVFTNTAARTAAVRVITGGRTMPGTTSALAAEAARWTPSECEEAADELLRELSGMCQEAAALVAAGEW